VLPPTDPIVVVDPDPGWATRFERVAAPLRAAVADLEAVVDHVGSTAVPGLAAKPVIDAHVEAKTDFIADVLTEVRAGSRARPRAR
jgi:GrpB-like predicted nucleotidyltransferase (UPF0157 family)